MATDGNGMAGCWLAFTTTAQQSYQSHRVERTHVAVKLHCGELIAGVASLNVSALGGRRWPNLFSLRHGAPAQTFDALFLLAPAWLPMAHHLLRYRYRF